MATRSRHPLAWVTALGLVFSFLTAQPAMGQTKTKSTPAKTDKARHRTPLAKLPSVPPIVVKMPDNRSRNELSGRLNRLVGLRVAEPLEKVDLAFLTSSLNPDVLPALAEELRRLKKRIDSKRARSILRRARSRGRKALRKLERAAKRDASIKVPEGDWLVFILATEDQSEDKDSLARIYAILRMLESMGDTPAVREMVNAYSAFGELVRIDLQRAFARLNTKAVAALIEAKQHDARKVRRWARRQLDDLGRAIPGEAVSTRDPVVLADVLLAFGRIKDLDATRVILSYVGHERARLRNAARQAIVALGEASTWFLKEAYQTQTGKKAPRGWNWKRSAQELFRIHDEARLATVYANVDRGQRALKQKDYVTAVAAFDKVLTRLPLFDARAAMAPAFTGHGRLLLEQGKDDAARASFEKALRLAPKADDHKRTRAYILYIEGKTLAAKGTPDRFILEQALKLDPNNQQARALLHQLTESKATRVDSQRQRILIAAGVLLLSLLAAAGVLFRRAKAKRVANTSDPETTASTEPVPTDEASAKQAPDHAAQPADVEPTIPPNGTSSAAADESEV